VEALRAQSVGEKERLATLGKSVDDAAARLVSLTAQPCLPFLLERQTNINVYQVCWLLAIVSLGCLPSIVINVVLRW
jgi:hypothetical protein